MGCCCSTRRAESDRAPIYFYCPRALEEREPLASTNGTASGIPFGILVDTNLDTSSPDTYRAPPAPLPFDVSSACSQTLSVHFGTSCNKTEAVAHKESQSLGKTNSSRAFEASAVCKGWKDSDCKIKSSSEHDSSKLTKVEPSLDEPVASTVEEEDVCPTCLEEYDAENPRIITKCEHHFHLSCILEWMERSDTCPICEQVMEFNNTLREYCK